MKSLAFLCFFLGFSAWADPSPATPPVTVEHVHPDVAPGPLEPLEDTGHIQEKMQNLPDLVAQEKFLKSIGFSEAWPTPEEVYQRVEKLEKDDGAVKARGLANVPLKAQAEMYEDVYKGPWGNSDPHADADREPAAVRRAMTSTGLHQESKFTPAEEAEVKAPKSKSGNYKSQ